ncbi:MAG: tetratricopeptide repeat protein [Desulfovibrionaceae bacterium]
MSVIYRSLEQLRRKKAAESPKRPRAAAAPPGETKQTKPLKGRRKLIVIFAGGFVLLGILAMAGVYLMQDQIETMVASPSTPMATQDEMRDAKLEALKKKAEEKRAQALAAAREAALKAREQLEQERQAAETAARQQTPGARQNTDAQRAGNGKEQAAAQKAPTQEQLDTIINEVDEKTAQGNVGTPAGGQMDAAVPQTDTAKKKWELETHFTNQAERNIHIRALEVEVAQAARTEGVDKARADLDKLVETVGVESLAATKWRGYLALKEKHFEAAEALYRQALLRSPNDLDSRYNLILALFMQHKIDVAKEVYGILLARHPLDDRVQAMGRTLGLK